MIGGVLGMEHNGTNLSRPVDHQNMSIFTGSLYVPDIYSTHESVLYACVSQLQPNPPLFLLPEGGDK